MDGRDLDAAVTLDPMRLNRGLRAELTVGTKEQIWWS